MCGIAGIVHFGALADAPKRARAMADSIAHRGPDDEGFWSDPDVALGFRRLAIVDLETGAQPMTNADRSVWVVYNGEIYNHRELRRELETKGHRFATDHADTEVIVHGWRQWGERLPEKLNGMFAFAVWDTTARTLFLARDRLGVKPLYLARGSDGAFVFGSEVRALSASGLVERKPDPRGLLEYLHFQNNWDARTPFAGVSLLPAGACLTLRRSGERLRRYWEARFDRATDGDLATAGEEYRSLLLDVLKRQLAADVPVMTYLSGGIDSSAVSAGAHRLDPNVQAYSCIFDLANVGADAIHDEREFSRAVATHLNIGRVELEVAQRALETELDGVIAALEHPLMGMSYVNSMIAGRVAKDAKVVLSGTGGDELSGGYVGRLIHIATSLGKGPLRERSVFGKTRLKDAAIAAYRPLLNFPISEAERHEALTPEFLGSAGEYSIDDQIGEGVAACGSESPFDAMLHLDATKYLHGLLLVEDKLSMRHSLEARVPLLDNAIVDFCLRSPATHLFDGETGKIVFREAVRPWVPDVIYRKPKMGFGPPDASWYRGPLRSFIEQRLSERRVRARGIFQWPFVERTLQAHMTGAANKVAVIWSLVCVDSWCEINGFYGGKLA